MGCRNILAWLAILSLAAGILTPILGSLLMGWAQMDALARFGELDAALVINHARMNACPSFSPEGDRYGIPATMTRSYENLRFVFYGAALAFWLITATLLVCLWRCPLMKPSEADDVSEAEERGGDEVEA